MPLRDSWPTRKAGDEQVKRAITDEVVSEREHVEEPRGFSEVAQRKQRANEGDAPCSEES